ncbi:MAG TPA: phospholipase D-like domain-containing protein [Caldimonas sp.]|nr:phospholipase D-like domain-containing protein [Caldimonas sp.]HEX4235483.1 phospholipase D-like domain-containing protein [Caldimonas sp.]
MTLHEFLARYLLTLHGIVVAIGLIVYVGVARSLPQRRDPSAAIAWVVALALLPYVAIPLYLMFGSRKLRMRDAPILPLIAAAAANDDEAASLWARRLGRSMGLAPAAPYRSLQIHADGAEARRAALAVIDGARSTLDVCTFILAPDCLGDEVSAALRRKTEEGVRVRVLIDGIGAWLGGRLDVQSLRRAGVEVVKFVPPFRSILRGRANLRNHRKMIVADASRLWCGGRNFAAEYFEGDPDRRSVAWHDLSFDLQGEIAVRAADQFEQDWAYATRREPPERRAPTAYPKPPADGSLAQLVPSGPEQGDDTVQALLVSGCFRAERRLLVVTPYFIPDATLLMALSLAARRGVQVDIVMPRRSNHRLADVARHRPLRGLAAAGARLWFTPFMLHAKIVVVDDQLALAGSANLDLRSLFLNYELMVAFYEPSDVTRFAAWIERERSGAVRYLPTEPGLLRDLSEGLLLWLAFQL